MIIYVFIKFCGMRNKAKMGVYFYGNGITNPLMYSNNLQLIIHIPNNNPIIYSAAFSQPSRP